TPAGAVGLPRQDAAHPAATDSPALPLPPIPLSAVRGAGAHGRADPGARLHRRGESAGLSPARGRVLAGPPFVCARRERRRARAEPAFAGWRLVLPARGQVAEGRRY